MRSYRKILDGRGCLSSRMILHSLLDCGCSYSMYVKSLIGANALYNSEIIISAGKETERLEEICRTLQKCLPLRMGIIYL